MKVSSIVKSNGACFHILDDLDQQPKMLSWKYMQSTSAIPMYNMSEIHTLQILNLHILNVAFRVWSGKQTSLHVFQTGMRWYRKLGVYKNP